MSYYCFFWWCCCCFDDPPYTHLYTMYTQKRISTRWSWLNYKNLFYLIAMKWNQNNIIVVLTIVWRDHDNLLQHFMNSEIRKKNLLRVVSFVCVVLFCFVSFSFHFVSSNKFISNISRCFTLLFLFLFTWITFNKI